MNNVPFYSNTDDDTHCVQAVFRMALKYFLPKSEFSWQQLDKLTHKQAGKGTWWFPAVAELNELGLNTTYIEKFNYERYYLEGNHYLKAFYGYEIANWFIQNSNIEQVRELIPKFLDKVKPEARAATLKDIDELLASGWLVGVEINVRVLQKRAGFNGHMVLIIAKSSEEYVIHDPGLPAHMAKRVSVKEFERAWSYAGSDKACLIAFNNS